eukprot:JP435797.1.p1 GENE.JP435797.1~~JP435797.1.p1  ORF type:complete len:388 (-),score=92.16 JP435797.1:219-1382(-)
MCSVETVVIKVGTSSLLNDDDQISLGSFARIVEVVIELKKLGKRVVLVTSGAVGIGRTKLGMTERPSTRAAKQAVAAMGQTSLMRIYEDLFKILDQHVAQVLVTRTDLMRKHQFEAVQKLFEEVFALDMIPIVNENDTLALQEHNFGDNDTLSALVANLVLANWLVLATDVDCLYSADPRSNPDAYPIHLVENMKTLRVNTSGGSSQWGTGGMATKIAAANLATAAGIRTLLLNSQRMLDIPQIISGELQQVGTQFQEVQNPVRTRKRWISFLQPMGKVFVDPGAAVALKMKKSLLPAGVKSIEGSFERMWAVEIEDTAGKHIGLGLPNYSSVELKMIAGLTTAQILEIPAFNPSDSGACIERVNILLHQAQPTEPSSPMKRPTSPV